MRSTNLRQCLATGRTRAFLALAATALLVSGCSTNMDGASSGSIPGPDPGRGIPADALNPLGPIAERQHELWTLPYAIAIGVFVLIFGGLAYIIVAFRDKGQTELPKQVHGNTRLEITWTMIPAVILVVIAVPTVQAIFELQDEPADDALIVSVIGKQYWWQFDYVDEGFTTASELHIPVGREVFIELDGTIPEDPGERATIYQTTPVLHSFWVPSLAGKRDWVPGTIRPLRIQADEPGVYPGLCAEFCGLSHANMRFTVIAHDPADYDAWVANQQSPAETPTSGLAAEGAEVFANNCVSCHAVAGLEANIDSRVGPVLTHFAEREAFAGYIFDSPYGDQVEDAAQAEEHLRQWLLDPASIKPGAQMPALGLSDDQIDALIAYLGTLE
ncbi:cytochrome c oxidase subunit II [soil metagenome]